MKKPLLFIFTLLSTGLYAQEHFAGINTSRRTGILNATVNPAELTNLKNEYEVNVLSFSANVSNNKISFGDITKGNDLDELLFAGNDNVNANVNIEILGPAFAFKIDKWGFAVTTAAKAKANVVEVNSRLGKALTTNAVDTDLLTGYLTANHNQRVAATTWGELGFSAGRDIFENDEHKLSVGITFKLLFPGSYSNIAIDQFNGNIGYNNTGDVYITDANANLNLAYSGSLADGFTDVKNYTDFFSGGLHGFSTDIGINYRWKDRNADSEDDYKINAGLSFQNMGKMTFKDSNNVSDNYVLNVPNGQQLSLSQFDGVDNLQDIEDILLQSGYVTLTQSNKNFKVNLPATMALYADVKVYNDFYVTGFLQQKLDKDNKNDQMGTQNIFTVTPRYSIDNFEVYIPFSSNEISGFTTGVGVRVGGFYIGSGSILTAAIKDTNQADAYLGYRFGF
jgi:hypothetical protein